MLIDDITIRVKAGKGGDGAVAFNKNIMSLGPTGADGGNGGNIYLEGISDLNALNQFRNQKEVVTADGKNGKGQYNDGRDGDDLILKIPVGTVIHNLEKKETSEIVKIGDRVLIAKGGRGGRGNFKFRSSTNTSPRQFTAGKEGESFTLRLELKLIADVGLIGLPNAGKSSLLNELTNANSKVANYPFTTLEPNLGVYYELILADIPGLIEGASGGRGLGIKFLRHIERTRVVFHLISAESDNPLRDYKIIKKELSGYSKDLAKKPEYLFLSKSDVVSVAELKKKITILRKISAKGGPASGAKKVIAISIHDIDSVDKVKDILNKIQGDK
ncbi:MAG: GTPase ObgE [Candidatus Yanofskybacteria bacterium]|nr:GTPase ObgE [Candidatus Yanofskybacteria bacterium]